MCGLGVLVAASLAPMVLPRMMTVQRLSVLEHVTAYGGVALFSGLILYDVQSKSTRMFWGSPGQSGAARVARKLTVADLLSQKSSAMLSSLIAA